MKSKPYLTETDLKQILDASVAEAKRNAWKVAIAIVDDGGHLLSFLRLDDCSALSAAISIEKARTSALGRRETRVYEEMINGGRTAFLSAPVRGQLEGGVPVVIDGHVIGAVGVSGVKSEEDAQIAAAGVNAISR
jgi:glc operon protein GlcG